MAAEPIPIGKSNGRNVSLDAVRRSTHLHVLGGSGNGKTKFLEHCIREDILAGHGVCLIDPEGSLYDDVVKWCASLELDKSFRKRRIHLFDPHQKEWRFQFNPLFVHPGEKPVHRSFNMIQALTQVWGGEDSRGTPAIRTTLRGIFDALMDEGLSLAEAFFLTSSGDPHHIAKYLTHDTPSPVSREMWQSWLGMTTRNHEGEFGGARRRLTELLADEDNRQIFAAYKTPIDFRECMDNGDVVLINLSPEAMGEDPSIAFGAMLVRELVYCASRRDLATAKQRPFFAYIDECAEYLTDDISRISARARKRGLHLILAHQWLEQLEDQSKSILKGVMAIQNKVIFGGLLDEDAVILADELFRTEYDLEIPVEALIRPTVVGYQRIWLNNWSEGEGENAGVAANEGTATVTSDGSGWNSSETTSLIYDEHGFPTPVSTASGQSGSSSVAQIASESLTRSYGKSRNSSRGQSESLAPDLEDRASAVHGLENVRHKAVARLRSIPQRHAVVKGAAVPSFDITTHDVDEPIVSERRVNNFIQTVMEKSPYTVPTEQAKATLLRQECPSSYDL